MSTDFDVFTERAALRKLTGDDTVEVLVGSTENTAGMILIQYWRGSLVFTSFWRDVPLDVPRRKGLPYELGPMTRENYDRDVIAEKVRKHREGAVGWAS